MGGRLLRQWLRSRCATSSTSPPPRRDRRAARVAARLRGDASWLDGVCDIERIIGRVAVGRVARATWRRWACARGRSRSCSTARPRSQRRRVAPELLAAAVLHRAGETSPAAILADPRPHLREGGVIADGFDAELDELRDIGTNSQQWLARYQAKLAARPASRR